MAGRGPAPEQPASPRRNHHVPARGEWKPVPGVGWQHGPTPEPPDGLMPASLAAWNLWMGGWVAAHWGAEALPALRLLVKIYDQVERGKFERAVELRLWMDTWG
jgi:hypothetical protein